MEVPPLASEPNLDESSVQLFAGIYGYFAGIHDYFRLFTDVSRVFRYSGYDIFTDLHTQIQYFGFTPWPGGGTSAQDLDSAG